MASEKCKVKPSPRLYGQLDPEWPVAPELVDPDAPLETGPEPRTDSLFRGSKASVLAELTDSTFPGVSAVPSEQHHGSHGHLAPALSLLE